MEIIKKCDKEELEAYEHQKKIIKIQKEMDERDHFSTLVSVPTGGGKTRIAADFCMERLENEENGNKVLWLSDTIDLLLQTIKRFKEKKVLRDIRYQLVCAMPVDDSLEKNGKQKKINVDMKKIKAEADILFASTHKLFTYNHEKNEDNECFREWIECAQKRGKLYIIYDEAHHIGAEQTNGFFEKIFNDEKNGISGGKFGLIGLTATVYRYQSPWKSFTKWFKDGYSEQENGIKHDESFYGKATESPIINRIEITTLQNLLDEGLLIKPDLIRIDDFKEGDVVSKNKGSKMEYLARKIKYHYKKDNWNKTIVFVDGVSAAKELGRNLEEKRVPSFVYTSDGDYEEADLKEFCKVGSKNYKIMIAVNMVSEGFDVRDLQTIYLYSKIESQIVLRQRIGRVLRVAENKTKATVYWQKYFKEKSGRENAALLKDETIEDDGVKESEEDIQREIGLWSKGDQLPAGMYLEKLPADGEDERTLYKRYEFLNILDLFGLDEAIKVIGHFDTDNRRIAVGKAEKLGYEQFYRVIRSDYFRVLIYRNEESTFEEYAKLLGVTSEELLENIKVTCFYVYNVKKADTEGEITKKRLSVNDNDLKEFYQWIIRNDIHMPPYEPIEPEEGINAEELEQENSEQKLEAYECEKIARLMKEKGIGKADNLIDGMKLHNQLRWELAKKRFNNEKQYSEILTYGKRRTMIYQQLLTAKAIMNVGAVYDDRTRGKLIGKDEMIDMAFCGKKANGTVSPIKGCISRVVNSLADKDRLFLASALIEVPDHICVRDEDIDEYTELLTKYLSKKFVQEDSWDFETLSSEFIMALGYAENDDIVRMQCYIFSDKLPRILQYVIYGKIYKELSKIVSFCKGDKLVADCQNEEYLSKKCTEILRNYDIERLDDDLTPQKDVIADFRPYLKAVPYYQGIKPEFLCRMLNVILWLGDKGNSKFVDTFGGSGTISMNVDRGLVSERSYNDLGALNYAFFKTIKNEKALKDLIGRFIDLVIKHTGNEEKAKDFFRPYEEILKKDSGDNEYDFGGKLSDMEEKYRRNAGKEGDKDKAEEKEGLDARLGKIEKNYGKIMEIVLNNSEKAINKFREIEEFLHPIMLKIGKLYKELKQENEYKLKLEERAFVFFMYNSLSNRHFYNDATIDLFAKFVGNYEKYIEDCKSIFVDINIENKDALNLIEERQDEDDIIWYHDIPYSETSNADYCAEWFDEVKFADNLSKCKGHYVVASRFNVCEGGRNGLYTLVEKKGSNMSVEKRDGIVRFFSRFVTEETAKRYRELFPDSNNDENRNQNQDENETNNKKWNHVKDEKKAKYIVFAYSRMESAGINSKNETGKNDQDKENCNRKKYYKNNAPLSQDSIYRMLKNTQYSNIPVEVMLTDMKLDTGKMPVQSCENEKIWYIPSFKMPTTYMNEPLIIIMDYVYFIYEMVLGTLAEEGYADLKTKEIAAAFRALYDERRQRNEI